MHTSHTGTRRGRRQDTRRVTARPAQSRDIARRPPAHVRHAAVPTRTDGMGAADVEGAHLDDGGGARLLRRDDYMDGSGGCLYRVTITNYLHSIYYNFLIQL